MPKRGPWKLDHDPEARPIGCNDAYGTSGATRHRRRGEQACQKCLDSAAHYLREYRRGQPKPRALKPCGTWAAAQRHRIKGEDLDFACRLAESKYKAELREKAGLPTLRTLSA
jgi:hypothetical protein